MLDQVRQQLIMKLLSEVCHRVPILSGLALITSAPSLRGLATGMAPERIATLRNGLRMRVNLNDFNGRMLFLFGTPDPKVITICKALLRKGDCFVDIGANHGAVGLLCADSVGADGEVHMFEPQPDLCAKIRDSVEASHAPWIYVHQFGLMDRDADLPFQVPVDHSGRGTFVGDEPTAKRANLPVRDISTVLPSVVGQKRFGVKLDIEGAEMSILPQLVAMPGLRFLVCECTTRPQKMWRVVRDAGLDIFGIPKNIFMPRVRWVRTSVELEQYHDLVAVRLNRTVAFRSSVHPSKLAVNCC